MIQIIDREVQIPTNEQVIGVQGDNLSQTRVFMIDKIVNGLDLSTYISLIQLQAIYPTHPPYFDILKMEIEGTKLKLTWNIADHDMTSKGKLYFQIQFSKVVGDEAVVYQTIKNLFVVAPTIEARAEYENMTPIVFEQYIADAKAEANRAKSIADGLVGRVDTATDNANTQANYTKGVGDTLLQKLANGDFKGDKGDGLNLAGSKNSLAELNQAFPNGDGVNTYLIGTDVYVWNGTAWINGGRFQGKSAYEQAKFGGYTGTEAQFMSELNDLASKQSLNTHKADPTAHTPHLSQSKVGTVHDFTGLNGITGTNISCTATITAPYVAGDTIKIDGVNYVIVTSNGEPLDDNAFVAGATIPLIVDTVGKKVNFKSGGGKATELLNFPLSIQLTEPTPINANHIWVKSANRALFDNIVIDDSIRLQYGNGSLMLIVDDTSNNVEIITEQKKINGVKSTITSYHNQDKDYDWKMGTSNLANLQRNYPMVYSRINDVLDMETSYRWTGTEWKMISQNGHYLIGSGQAANGNLPVYNIIDRESVHRHVSLLNVDAMTGNFTNVSFHKNGKWVMACYNTAPYFLIFKRIGDVFELYNTGIVFTSVVYNPIFSDFEDQIIMNYGSTHTMIYDITGTGLVTRYSVSGSTNRTFISVSKDKYIAINMDSYGSMTFAHIQLVNNAYRQFSASGSASSIAAVRGKPWHVRATTASYIYQLCALSSGTGLAIVTIKLTDVGTDSANGTVTEPFARIELVNSSAYYINYNDLKKFLMVSNTGTKQIFYHRNEDFSLAKIQELLLNTNNYYENALTLDGETLYTSNGAVYDIQVNDNIVTVSQLGTSIFGAFTLKNLSVI